MRFHLPSTARLSFQAKVLIPVITFLILIPAITVWILDGHVEKRSRDEALKTLTTVRAVFRNYLDIRERNLEVQFRNMVNEPRFKAVVQLGDTQTMEAYLRDALAEFDEDVQIAVYTPGNFAMPSTGVGKNDFVDLEDFEHKVSSNIQTAFEGQTNASLSVYNKKAYNLISVPIHIIENTNPLGVITLGIELGQNAVNDLKALTRTEVLILVGSDCVAGTLNYVALDTEYEALFEEAATGNIEVYQHILDGEHFHVLSGKLESSNPSAEELTYVLLSSYEEWFQALSATRTTLLVFSVLGIGISVITIMILIRNVTKPLRALRDGAEAVGRGDFSKRVETTSTDECGDLAHSFNQMTSNLQSSRAALEANVKELEKTQEQLMQRETRLRESEEGLRLIIEGARDHVIFTIDDHGRIKRWNGAAERMLGYHSDEVTQVSYNQFFSPEDREAETDKELLRQALETGRSEFEGWRVGKDGNRFWADVTLSRLDSLPGAADGGYVEIARDITSRKKAEKALVEARNAAEASNRAKNEFMGNMSHEIRTPMNGIIGMTSLLLEDEMGEEQRDLVDTIKTSADSLLAIIDDILDISKIEAGQMEISLVPVNLIELLEITVESFAHICAKKNLSLNVCIGKEVPPLFETDPTRVRQILSNLIGNAVKFTEKGGIRIDVDYESIGHELVVSVQDTGIGIPKDKIDQLFTPFFQVESTNSRRFGGTGLGLSISRKIANLLHGEIRVESIYNLGSRFSFMMKAKPMEEEGGLIAFPGKNILLLTNNPLSKISIEDQVHNWGAHIQAFDISAERLKQAVEEKSFDIIILDDSDTSDTNPVLPLEPILDSMAGAPPYYIRIQEHNQKGRSSWPGKGVSLNKPVQPTELNAAFCRLLTDKEPKSRLQTNQLTNRKELNTDFANLYPHDILIVEDNNINAKVLETILKKLGYSPKIAANGEECLKALEKENFDIIFMDLQMPVMDGYNTTVRILNSDTIKHPLFITAFTANARQDDRDACQAVGMHDFVSKPARPKKITDVLLRAHAWLEEQVPAGK